MVLLQDLVGQVQKNPSVPNSVEQLVRGLVVQLKAATTMEQVRALTSELDIHSHTVGEAVLMTGHSNRPIRTDAVNPGPDHAPYPEDIYGGSQAVAGQFPQGRGPAPLRPLGSGASSEHSKDAVVDPRTSEEKLHGDHRMSEGQKQDIPLKAS